VTTQKPYVNIGAGRIILPGPKPVHHALIDDAIYQYPYWVNVDRNGEPGIDRVVDVFRYPWPFEDNSFDGALLTHLVEHIPHDIRAVKNMTSSEAVRFDKIAQAQDGWYAFWSELYRVLTPGAVVHVLSPYAWSQGAMTDPTHTRYITEHVFTHSMAPDPNSPFKYETGGIHFEQVEPARFGISPMYQHLVAQPGDGPDVQNAKTVQLQHALMTQINVAFELAVKLQAVK
jgi:SAM-dependent methyltransferase